MTIAVVIGTCLIFLAVGWTGSGYAYLALVIGAIVCIAISNAGTTAQDLKTGYLVGSTPRAQQAAILIGVLSSVAAIGWTTDVIKCRGDESDGAARACGRPGDARSPPPR